MPLFLVGGFVSVVFVAGLSPASAEAGLSPVSRGTAGARSGGGGDENNTGNGSHNRNISAVRSPTSNRGYQHTSTSGIGGATSVQNALCRNVRVCTITQNVTVNFPDGAVDGDPGTPAVDASQTTEPSASGLAAGPDGLDTELLWLEPGLGDLW